MKHLTDGRLRRLRDEPEEIGEGERAHLKVCSGCQASAERIARDAARAQALLIFDPPIVDHEAALLHLRHKGLGAVAPKPSPWRLIPVAGRRVSLTRRPLVAVALVVLIGATLVGTGVATNLLKIFEPEQVVAVPVSADSIGRLPDLSAFGTINILKEPEATVAATPGDAADQSGLDVLVPGTLREVKGEVIYTVVSTGSGSFTFDSAKASTALAKELPPPLAEINGSTLVVQFGPAIIQTVGRATLSPGGLEAAKRAAESAGAQHDGSERPDFAGLFAELPQLVIVQMKAPVVSSDGPSVEEYREALLSLPDISPSLAAQIRSIGNPSSTLPLPIPVDLATSHPVEINGAKAVAVGDNTGLGSGVIWQSKGMVYGVAGMLPEDDVLQIARSLH